MVKNFLQALGDRLGSDYDGWLVKRAMSKPWEQKEDKPKTDGSKSQTSKRE